MDPDACLKEAIEALLNDDAETFNERLQNYDEWRSKQGFEPRLQISGDVLRKVLDSAGRSF
jgi:hypothetical protein